MFSTIFLGALCFGTTVEALQTMTHSDHLDVMHEPLYITVLAGINFIVWCLVFKLIGGYTFHQRTAIEAKWLKKNPHLPCPRHCTNQYSKDEGSETKEYEDYISPQIEDINQSEKHLTPKKNFKDLESNFDDPRYSPLNLFRDLVPCFILVITCILIYLIDQEEYPNAPKYVDPLMALLTIVLLIITSIPMTRKASLILLQGIPDELDNVHVVCEDIKNVFSDYITSLHEVHVWCLVPNKVYATLHIVFRNEESYTSALSPINSFLLKYGINHVTIQPEFSDHSKDVDSVCNTCQIQCPNNNCFKKRCCMTNENNDF